MSRPDMHDARVVLAAARRQRAEYLVSLAEGLLTPLDLVEAATSDSGRALRKIGLRQMHLNCQGWGRRRTDRLLAGLASRLDLDPAGVQEKQVAWLIDPRSGGRRFLAWLDVQHEKTEGPWSGFPMSREVA